MGTVCGSSKEKLEKYTVVFNDQNAKNEASHSKENGTNLQLTRGVSSKNSKKLSFLAKNRGGMTDLEDWKDIRRRETQKTIDLEELLERAPSQMIIKYVEENDNGLADEIAMEDEGNSPKLEETNSKRERNKAQVKINERGKIEDEKITENVEVYEKKKMTVAELGKICKTMAKHNIFYSLSPKQL